jgi:hypothetical protein
MSTKVSGGLNPELKPGKNEREMCSCWFKIELSPGDIQKHSADLKIVRGDP